MQRNALLLSIASAVLGTVLLRAYMTRFEQQATGGPRATVLVLTADLANGEALAREALSTRELPAAYRESRHIPASALDQVIGARLAVPGRANESLLWTDLSSIRGRARQLSALVPEGMRAITVDSASRDLGLLLTPGDRVDVLSSSRQTTSDKSLDSTTRTVAQDLLVLAIGSDLGGPSSNAKVRQGAVTLSVTLEQARLLASAEQTGTLRLVLRNPDDLVLTENASPSKGTP